MVSSMLLMTLTMCLSSNQASHSMDYLDSVQVTHSTGRNNNAQDRLSTEVISHSRSSRESSASGQSADSKASQMLINRTIASKEPEPVGNEMYFWSGITLTKTLALSVQQEHVQTHIPGADQSSHTSPLLINLIFLFSQKQSWVTVQLFQFRFWLSYTNIYLQSKQATEHTLR